jgi:hypothetical protein
MILHVERFRIGKVTQKHVVQYWLSVESTG